jgi:DNA-binding MarR family transcriptional regulator
MATDLDPSTPHATGTGTGTGTVEVDWLNEDEQRAWRTYIETQADLLSALERDLEPHGFTLGDYRVLVLLSEATGNELRMSDLADQLQLSPSGLTRRLDGLVADGLVRRQPGAKDRRVMMAVLTGRGMAAMQRVAPVHVASVRARLLDHLDRAQIEQLGTIFGQVAAALERSEPTR